MTASVSVAMPVYNGERFLRAQLESIVDQTVRPGEIVIADDGSTDGTVELVRDFARSSPVPVILLGGDHVGLNRNLARALEGCTGEAIALCDQDDLWDPRKLEAAASAFEDPGTAMWFSDAALIDQEGEPTGRRLWSIGRVDDETVRSLQGTTQGVRRLIHGGIWGSTMVIRRSLLELVLPFPAELDPPDHLVLHDAWITVLAYAHGDFVADPRPLTLYRTHAGQTTRALRDAKKGTEPQGRSASAAKQLTQDVGRSSLVIGRLQQHESAWAPHRRDDVRELARWNAHLKVRSSPRGPRRTWDVLAQAASGNYRRYGRGMRTALADVVGARGSAG
ncbi:glycosyltransferase family 2 protein [Microbacterium thalassium]|uniref:Glycosyltransferase 2-like domain-containing protein n=1 Tax=Microbacterium thalassium TaxID=362649 RepID=A0A7X0FLU5_9MICO|nr:glycosyltransferase family 2 protein [Microbacterium thalassium]MBB6389878.1 hypothetical protein [Microbacterium thalassium]GLK24565.1 hypothetical protein GCM10017607_18830 [Microbacterium thalassium]